MSGETIDHLLNCCRVLAATLYIRRHNHVVKALHWAICKSRRVANLSSSPGRHSIESFVELPDGGHLFWELAIPTAQRISANRPDLVLKYNNRAFLVDVSVPLEQNVAPKAAEKKMKYEPLRQEVVRLWGLESCTVVPVILGSLGGLSKSILDELTILCPETSILPLLQQCALLGSLNILGSTFSI